MASMDGAWLALSDGKSDPRPCMFSAAFGARFYLAIAFTLVLSLVAVRLIGGLPHAMRPGSRHWPHIASAAWQLIVTAVAFWTLLSYREAKWTLPAFGLVLMNLGTI